MITTAGALLATALFAIAPSATSQTAWEAYLEEPSAENAQAALEADYSVPANEPLERRVEADLGLVGYLVASGDEPALQLALRLSRQFRLSADLSEYLDDIVGSIVRTNPKAYLESTNAAGVSCPGIASLPEAFVDRLHAQRLELRARLAAIEQVSDQELASARKKCAKQLQDALGDHDF